MFQSLFKHVNQWELAHTPHKSYMASYAMGIKAPYTFLLNYTL